MKISEAINLYCVKYPEIEKQKLFVGVIENQKWDQDKSINEYLRYIENQTVTWLNNALPGYKTYNSKRKLQSALNSFFNIKEVRTELGPELITRVQSVLSTALKDDKLSMENTVAQQDITDSTSSTDTETDTESEIDNDEHVQNTNNDAALRLQFQSSKDLLTKVTVENTKLKRKIDGLKDIALTLLRDFQVESDSYIKIIEQLCDYTMI